MSTRAKKKKVKDLSKAMEVLTPKQAEWVKLVLEGVSYREAYVKAFDYTKDDPKAVNTLCNKLRRKSHIQEALRKGQAEVNTTHILWTKEKAIVKLLKLLQKAEEDLEYSGLSKTNTDTILNAIKELNGIAGTYYKDSKKYEIDLAQLELNRMRFEFEKNKLEGPEEDTDDDGFLEAISSEARNVWMEDTNAETNS